MKSLLFILIFSLLFQNKVIPEVLHIDEPFFQESHTPYIISDEPESNDVLAIHVDSKDNVWAGTKAG